MSQNTIASLRIGQPNAILEAKVYRKWISKGAPNMKELAFCCILIDQEPYLLTLANKISLKFGKITKFDVLQGQESEFPEHHFEFTAYNQLASRVPYQDENSKMIYPLLTDHLGCIRSISDVTPFGDSNKGQSYWRKVDIENLDGNIVEFTMKDELATHFNKQDIENIPPLVIIAVSSYRVTKFKDVQLSATSATHYYINPQTPEAEYAFRVFKQKYASNPPLQRIRFMCESIIASVEENRGWHYASCSQCNKKSTEQDGVYTCEDHGLQDPLTYRYNFRAKVTDATTTAQFTFFTKAGEKIDGRPCSELAEKYRGANPQRFPSEIVGIIGAVLVTSTTMAMEASTSKENYHSNTKAP
ncbi:nucleic acid-binding, OB-fold protein [Tanacetum coccineum]